MLTTMGMPARVPPLPISLDNTSYNSQRLRNKYCHKLISMTFSYLDTLQMLLFDKYIYFLCILRSFIFLRDSLVRGISMK